MTESSRNGRIKLNETPRVLAWQLTAIVQNGLRNPSDVVSIIGIQEQSGEGGLTLVEPKQEIVADFDVLVDIPSTTLL